MVNQRSEIWKDSMSYVVILYRDCGIIDVDVLIGVSKVDAFVSRKNQEVDKLSNYISDY